MPKAAVTISLRLTMDEATILRQYVGMLSVEFDEKDGLTEEDHRILMEIFDVLDKVTE